VGQNSELRRVEQVVPQPRTELYSKEKVYFTRTVFCVPDIEEEGSQQAFEVKEEFEVHRVGEEFPRRLIAV
jgi:hypothetical protein